MSNSSIIRPTSYMNNPPTPSATPTIDPNTESNSTTLITQGVAAGIGVGAGVGGLVLGALVAFLILMNQHRRKRSHRASSNAHEKQRSHHRKELNGGVALNLRDYLPQPADDSTLCSELTALSEFIEQHVDNYYDSNAASAKALPSEISASAQEHRMDQPKVDSLLRNPSTRAFAIRSLILRTILAAISPTSNPTRTLLPQEIVQFRRNMELHSNDNPEGRSLSRSKAIILTQYGIVFNIVLSRWRVLSSYLLRLSNSKPNVTYESDLDSSIQANIRALDEKLDPFHATPQRESREAHLANVMRRASRFGILLFSQPAEWTLEWASRTNEAKLRRDGKVGIVVRPALVRISDEEGRMLHAGVVVLPIEEVFIKAQ